MGARPVKHDFDPLRARYPWPAERPQVLPAEWSVDGGGRELITDLISKTDDFLIVEIGVFLGSSAKRWLAVSPKVRVIAIDPWQGAWWPEYARKNGRHELVEQLTPADGPYMTFLSSLWDYRDRLFPVRCLSPAKLCELAGMGIRPDLIYFDSDKTGDDIEVAHQLFPSAVLSGDDWTWGALQGYPIRKAARRLAAKHGYYVHSDRATWVLDQRPYVLKDYMNKSSKRRVIRPDTSGGRLKRCGKGNQIPHELPRERRRGIQAWPLPEAVIGYAIAAHQRLH